MNFYSFDGCNFYSLNAPWLTFSQRFTAPFWVQLHRNPWAAEICSHVLRLAVSQDTETFECTKQRKKLREQSDRSEFAATNVQIHKTLFNIALARLFSDAPMGAPHQLADSEQTTPVADKGDATVEVAEGSPSKKPRNLKRWVPILLLALSALGFSIQALMVRSLTVQGIGTFQLLIFRGSCQAFGCCMCLSAKSTRFSSWLGSTRLEQTALLVRAVVGYGAICFGFLCVSAMPLADSQILGQTAPIFAAAFARVFLKEEWHCSEFFSAIAAILGVGFISKPETLLDASSVSHLGVFYGLLSAFFAGATYVIIRFLGTAKVDWASVLLAQALGQMVLSPVALVISGQELRLFSRQQLAVALGMGFFGFASQVAMTKGMQKEKSATASLTRQSLCPVFAMLWQPLCFPEDQLSWTSFAGFGTIMVGLLVTVMAKAFREPVPKATKYSEVAGNEEGGSVRNDDTVDDSNIYGKRSFPESPLGLENEIIEPQNEPKTALAKDVP
eukprot:s1693_g2.t1